jgi:hypothetical protein
MLRDAQVIAIVPAHAKAGIGAVKDAMALDVNAVGLLDHDAILDGNAIAFRAAGRLIPRVRSRSVGRANQQSGKAQGER